MTPLPGQVDWVHRCMVVPAAIVLVARYTAGKFGSSAQDMFLTPLGPIGGAANPTHYMSHGYISRDFADMVTNPAALIEGAAELGVTVSPADAQKLLAASDVSEEQWTSALPRLSLEFWHPVGDGMNMLVDNTPDQLIDSKALADRGS